MKIKLAVICLLGWYPLAASAITFGDPQTITFDDAINSETSHFFDGNSDGIPDVIFSTTDPFGFNTAGPGPDQLFVHEPGLEGTTSLTPDLRIDFLQGAVGGIGFGFATISPMTGVVQIFNENHIEIGSQAFAGDFFDLTSGAVSEQFGSNTSSFPEGFVDIPFANVAAYAIIDFNDGIIFDGNVNDIGGGRYIIDDFTYTAAGTETIALFEGADPLFPVLPSPFNPENPEFKFELEILEDGLGTLFPIFIDPVIAVGYTYTVDSGSNVATVLIPTALPNGDGDFIIEINGVEYAIIAGTVFDILAVTGIVGGVDTFRITGIDTTETLDPTDNLAFNTGLTFVNAGMTNITQTPITFDTDATNVPEPNTLLLFLLGLTGFWLMRKQSSFKEI